MSKEITEEKIIAEAHCDMRRWCKIFLLRCLLALPFIIATISYYLEYGLGELAIAFGVFSLPLCFFALETLRHLKDRVVFYENAIAVNGKKMVLEDSPEVYFSITEGISGITGAIHLIGRDVTYVKDVRDLFFRTYMNYEEWVQGENTAIYRILKRIVPTGEKHIPVYAFKLLGKKTTMNYACGITNKGIYLVEIYAGESLIGFYDHIMIEKKDINGISIVKLGSEHEIRISYEETSFTFTIKDVMYGALMHIKNLPFRLNQESEVAQAMEIITEWQKEKGYG